MPLGKFGRPRKKYVYVKYSFKLNLHFESYHWQGMMLALLILLHLKTLGTFEPAVQPEELESA